MLTDCSKEIQNPSVIRRNPAAHQPIVIPTGATVLNREAERNQIPKLAHQNHQQSKSVIMSANSLNLANVFLKHPAQTESWSARRKLETTHPRRARVWHGGVKTAIAYPVKPHLTLQNSPNPFRLLLLDCLYVQNCIPQNIFFAHYSLVRMSFTRI